MKLLVTGAGGFIGHHLVSDLKRDGHWVRGVDVKHPQFGPTSADEFLSLDLRDAGSCSQATEGVDEVFALAADMGGMGYISANHAKILRDNQLI
ncbi:MAG: NAD-dependent epimerase/dehydratase family protein, partial [Acidimicrobiaceae bacterium]|nr:NAD-dependent epimerase/dehydratase family protein [Acidimicrobiaceae bacterium]